MATSNSSSTTIVKAPLAPDRFLPACPINYEFPHLFLHMVEMEYIPETDMTVTILKYPENRDERFFKSEAHQNDFESNIIKFSYPFLKTLRAAKEANPNKYSANTSSSLVQFYTFVFTDENRIRQYGFCRSAQSGKSVICLVSYLPWHNVLITLLNKIATIINEKETSTLYHFLEAIYEYELPKPGSFAEIFSHDGLESYCFYCPDRRVVPSINENRNLLKFFAFFDLEKIIKIFTALLLERHILIVSKDLENLTSCALALEYLIHPLEWFHAFAPIMPEHIDIHVFNQPFPFIYGIHSCVYEKLSQAQLDECVILKVDERQIINGDKDQLPENVADYLRRKLRFFQEAAPESSHSNSTFYDQSYQPSVSSSGSMNKYNTLLRTGTIQAFRDSVLMIIDDYRSYLKYDSTTERYSLNEDVYFQMKNVYTESSNKSKKKYFDGENEFYHEFRITQAFEEFCRDRADYLKAENEFNKASAISNSVHYLDTANITPIKQFQKDFIETLFEQYNIENSKFQQIIKSSKKKFDAFKNKTKDNVSIMKKLLNQASNTPIQNGISNPLKNQSSVRKDSKKGEETKEVRADLFNTKHQRLQNHRSSSSSESSNSSCSNDEKLKEAIRQFTNESDTVNMTLDKNLDNLSKEIDLEADTLENQSYNRVTMDLTNDPDIKKYMEATPLSDDNQKDKNSEIIKLVDIDTESNELSEKLANPIDSPIKTTEKTYDPFDMDQFNPTIIPDTTSQLTAFESKSPSTLSWLTEQINQSIAPVNDEKKEEEKKPVDTYQSIIDEFDPMASNGLGSVSSKVNHFNKVNLNNLTPKPFVQNNKVNNTVRPNYNYNMPVKSSFNPLPITSSTMSQSNSHNSIQSFLNPTPFYGGFNNYAMSQPSFHSVSYPQNKNQNMAPAIPVSQSADTFSSINTNQNRFDSNKTLINMSLGESLKNSVDIKK